MFRNKASFYGEELSTPRPTPKMEDHPLSAVRDCLFSIFAATLHIGDRSSFRNLRTRHAVVTETHLGLPIHRAGRFLTLRTRASNGQPALCLSAY